MRASDSHRMLFIHVQKTGGSTIDAMLDREIPDTRSVGKTRHAPLGKILQLESGLRDYWIFGFVRNPWARMVSWWAMIRDVLSRAENGDPECLQRIEVNPVFWKPASGYAGFDDFLEQGPKDLARFGRPQVEFLQEPQGGRRADFIGRLETFDADIAAVRTRLGLPSLESVPHDNATAHDEYREYYSNASRDLVGQIFAKDVSAFGYRF